MNDSKGWKIGGRLRRIILLVGVGLLVGALATTLLPAIPRPIDVRIQVDGVDLAGRQSRAVIRSGDEVVVEVTERLGGEGRSALNHRFWLSPEPHEIEISVVGCRSLTRRFNPKDTDAVSIRVACERER